MLQQKRGGKPMAGPNGYQMELQRPQSSHENGDASDPQQLLQPAQKSYAQSAAQQQMSQKKGQRRTSANQQVA